MAALLTLVGLSAACTSSSGTASRDNKASNVTVASPPPVTSTPQVLQVTGLTLPVDAYQPTRAQRAVVNNAVVTLTNACMRRFGFSDALPPAKPAQPSTLARRYGVTDPAVAEHYGYHLAPDEDVRSDTKPPAGGSPSQAE